LPFGFPHSLQLKMAAMIRFLSLCIGVTVASSASFLQISQDKRFLDLPEVSKVLSNSNTVLDTLNAQVSSLQARLTEAQLEGAAATKAKKTEYEAKLKMQHESNVALAQKNEGTKSHIKALKEENLKLRSKAQMLSKQSASLTSTLQVLRGNVSTVDEFLGTALKGSTELLLKAPQLQVLEDFDKLDAEAARVRAHESQLNEVKMSLLQIALEPEKQDAKLGAHSVLDSLHSALDVLAKEQNQGLESLKGAFEKEFQAGEQYHNNMLKEEADLNAAEKVALENNERLTAAVTHLEDAHETLLQKVQRVRSYMQRLGSPSHPEDKK